MNKHKEIKFEIGDLLQHTGFGWEDYYYIYLGETIYKDTMKTYGVQEERFFDNEIREYYGKVINE